jgi:hypothetical protein
MRDRTPIQEGKAGTQTTATVQTGLLQRKCACGSAPGVDGQCDECREKQLGLQRRASSPAAPPPTVPPIVYEALNSPGQPLDAKTRELMEPRFGHDFSKVRVHKDAKAAESVRAVNALAYTVGRDVVFGVGQYKPETSEGRKLMTHELTHVVQQSELFSTPGNDLTASPFNSPLEQEAMQVAEKPEEQPTALRRVTTPVIQSQREGEAAQTGRGEGGIQPEQTVTEYSSSAIQVPATKYSKEFSLFPENYRPKKSFGPVEVSLDGKIKLEGSLRLGEPSTEVGFSAEGASIEAKVRQSFGEVKFTGDIEPGKVSKVGIGIGTEIVDIEFAANADLEKPFQLNFEKSIADTELHFGEWTFKGEVKLGLEVNFAPNLLWPGWVAIAKETAARSIQAGRTVIAVARGAFFAGEVGTVTTLGAVLIAAGVATLAIAWVGFGLYETTKALREGQNEAIGYAFSNGYASILAQLTSNRLEGYDEKSISRLLALDWKRVFQEEGERYHQTGPESANALPAIEEAGKAAILQDIDTYMKTYGYDAWRRFSQDQQARVAQREDERKHIYLDTLYKQVRQGEKRIGINLPVISEVPEKGSALQRSAANSSTISSIPPIVHEVLSSPGQPLDAKTRETMEPRFGHDFSHVRIHTDAKAAESARAVNAVAYTVGRDVVFGAGQHKPETREGGKLMAHELTHVVQQGSAGSQPGNLQRKSQEKSSDKKKITKVVSEEEKAKKAEKISGLIDDIYDIVEETMVIQPDLSNELSFKEHWKLIEKQIVELKGNLFPKLAEKTMIARLGELDGKERQQVSRGVLQRLVASSSTSTEIDYHKEYTTLLSERMRLNIEEGEAGYITVRSALLNTFGTLEVAKQYYKSLVPANFPPGSKMKGHDTLVHPLLQERLARTADLLKKKEVLEVVSASIRKIGGFNIRENRNRQKTRGNLVNLSKHSFGWAIDIDDDYNPNIHQSDFPRTMVMGLTGEDVYTGEAAKTIREGGTYDELLKSAKHLREASDLFKEAFESEETLGKALINYLNKHGAKLKAEDWEALLALIKKVPAKLRDEARGQLNAKPKAKHDKQKEKEPEQPEGYQKLTAWIAGAGVKEEDRVATTSFLLEAYRLLLESRYQQDTKAHKKGEKIEATATGAKAQHIAAHGFINLRPELITALVSSDGGGLSWLGAVEKDTKDFMHFELSQPPALPKVGDYPLPDTSPQATRMA